jgi:hypothetical protein
MEIKEREFICSKS